MKPLLYQLSYITIECVFIWYQRWESNPLTIRAMRIVLRSIHNWFTLFRTSPTVYLGTTFPCRLLLYHIETHSAGIEPAHLSNSPGCKSATSARPSIWVCFYMVDTSFEDGPLVDHYHLYTLMCVLLLAPRISALPWRLILDNVTYPLLCWYIVPYRNTLTRLPHLSMPCDRTPG